MRVVHVIQRYAPAIGGSETWCREVALRQVRRGHRVRVLTLDIMTELSTRVPADLHVKFEEVNIDRKVVRVKVSAENYEAADRLENVLSASAPFEGADVAGQIKNTKRGTITFSINIPLEVEEGDS